MDPMGHKRWAIAEGYIPSQSALSDRALISHETACILNAGDADAHVAITIFFADRNPVGPYRVMVAARRTLHLRFNDLSDPQQISHNTDYASPIPSQGNRLSAITPSTRPRPEQPDGLIVLIYRPAGRHLCPDGRHTGAALCVSRPQRLI
jgi:hypothetical protein